MRAFSIHDVSNRNSNGDPNKQHFVVKFASRGAVVEFHRWEMTMDEAVADAKNGFQWAYGYWPDEPVAVYPCSGCGDRTK